MSNNVIHKRLIERETLPLPVLQPIQSDTLRMTELPIRPIGCYSKENCKALTVERQDMYFEHFMSMEYTYRLHVQEKIEIEIGKNKDLRDLLLLLEPLGVHLVGGALRDYARNLPFEKEDCHAAPLDFDIMIDKHLHAIYDLDFNEDEITVRFACNDTIMLIFYKGVTYEVTSAYKHQITATEYMRRDFTCNTIRYDVKKRFLYDPCSYLGQGSRDVFSYVTTSGAHHDPIRVIRAARMCAKGMFMSEELYRHIKVIVSTDESFRERLLEQLATNRGYLEVKKAFQEEHPVRFIWALYALDLLFLVFPSLRDGENYGGGKYHPEDIIEHNILCMELMCLLTDATTDWRLRLAALLHDVGKPRAHDIDKDNFARHAVIGADMVEKDLTALGFPNKDISYIKTLVATHMDVVNDISEKALRKHVTRVYAGGVELDEWLLLTHCDKAANFDRTHHSEYPSTFAGPTYACEYLDQVGEAFKMLSPYFSIKDLHITGNEIMSLAGMTKGGPLVGKVLHRLHETAFDNPAFNNNQDLTSLAEIYILEEQANEMDSRPEEEA